MIERNLNSKDDLTILVNVKGIQNWEQLTGLVNVNAFSFFFFHYTFFCVTLFQD
jgi:hypothetical protein